eukprot:403332142
MKCRDAIYGCSSCAETSINNGTSTQKFVTCNRCSDGLFLLSNKTYSTSYPQSMTYCISDCKKAHSSYVNDYTTGKCQYCGQYCTSCSLQYGCSNCPGEVANKGWVSTLTLDSSISFYQTFKQCKQCDNSKICSKCSASNSATSRFSFSTYQTASLCTQTKVAVAGYTYCTQCKDGYYLKPNAVYNSTYNVNLPSCVQYTGSGVCLEPSSQTACEICDYNYDEVTISGTQVCGNCQTLNTFYPDAVRCQLTSLTAITKHIACRDGFVNNATGRCVSSCPTGQYGQVVFNRRGLVESTYCIACPSTCYECNSATECTSCKKQYYLDTGTTYRKMSGTCLKKFTTVVSTTYYVNSVNGTSSKTPNLITGSSSNSFNTIIDAIRKAQEFGAQFENCQVKIILKSGTHAMLSLPQQNYYQARFFDETNQGMQLTIEAESSATGVTVLYKLRDKWNFKVGRNLIINYVTFDASDSIITPDTDTNSCLQDPDNNCCDVNYITQSITPSDLCYFRERPTEECVTVTSGGGLFVFDSHPQMILTAPPTLTLNFCVFKNFMYEFNSFIELNDIGGFVSITGSVFSNFNTCGSIIRNKKAIFQRNDLTQNTYPNVYQTRVNNYQGQLLTQQQTEQAAVNPYSSCSLTSVTSTQCFDISIFNSKFEYFNVFKENRTDAVWVNPQYKMQYYGSVVDLESFKGHITISLTTFLRNFLRYYDCEVGRQIRYMDKTKFVDRYPSLGTKTAIQMRSLITILNHERRFTLLKNTFDSNAVIKGLLYLDMKDRFQNNQRFLFGQNTFQRTFSFFDAQIAYIRARGKDLKSVYTTVPDSDENLFCTGYQIELSMILLNVGCPLHSGGLIEIQCVNFNEQPTYANDTFVQPSILPMKESYVATNYTYTQQLFQISYSGYTYNIDYRINLINQTNCQNNAASGGYALVDITGLPRISILNDFQLYNGDSSIDMIAYVNSPVFQNTTTLSSVTIAEMMKNPNTYPGQLLSQGIFRLRKVQYIEIKNVSFYMTFVIETGYDKMRANNFNFQEFYGILEMDRFNFKNLYGVNCAYVKSIIKGTILQTDDRANGFGYPLMRFNLDDRVNVYFRSNIQSSAIDYNRSAFIEVVYIKHTYNTEYHLMPNFSNPNAIYAKYVYMTNLLVQGCQTFYSRIPFLDFNADIIYFHNHNYNYHNRKNPYGESYFSKAPIVAIRIKKPYIDTSGNLITPTFISQKITFFVCNFAAGGTLYDLQYSPTTNEVEPTTTQVQISNFYNSSQIFTWGSLSNSTIMKINVNSIKVSISDLTITELFSGNNNTNLVFGGGISLVSAGELTLDNFNVKDFSALQQTATNGGGRFLYYNNRDLPLILTVQNSIFTCETDFDEEIGALRVDTKIIHQSSVFQIQSQGQSINATFINNQFINCARSNQGAAINIVANQLKENNIKFINNTFKYNYALNGGSIYCELCTITSFFNNRFFNGYAQLGGDVYLKNPIQTSIIFDSNQHSESATSSQNPGATVYISDGLSTSSSILSVSFISSRYQKGLYGLVYMTSSNFGNALTLYSKANINLVVSDMQLIDNMILAYKQTGGLFYVNNTLTQVQAQAANTNFTMTLNNANFITNYGVGGTIVEISLWYQTSTLSIQDSRYSENSGYSNPGGLFRLLAQKQNLVEIVDCEFEKTFSSKNGGTFYMTGSANQITITNSQISRSETDGFGGFAYMKGSLNQTLSVSGSIISSVQSNDQGGGFAYIEGQNVDVVIKDDSIVQTAFSFYDGGLIQAIATDTVNMQMIQSELDSFFAENGGIAHLEAGNNIVLQVDSSYIQNSEAYYNGGAFSIISGNNTQIFIQNVTKFLSIVSSEAGGVIYCESPYQTIEVIQSQFTNVTGLSGGILASYSTNQVDINIVQSSFSLFKASSGGSVIQLNNLNSDIPDYDSQINMIISGSTFSANIDEIWKTFPTNYLMLVNKLTNSQSDSVNAISFGQEISANITSIQNSYSLLNVANQGSYFNLNSKTMFNDQYSIFTQNAAITGGVIYCDSCSANFTGTRFIDNFAMNGGIIYAKDQFNLIFNNPQIYNTKAFANGGVFYLEKLTSEEINASLVVQDSSNLIQFNQAVSKGGLIYSSHENLSLKLLNSMIYNSYSSESGGLIHLDKIQSISFSGLSIKNVTSAMGSLVYSKFYNLDLTFTDSIVECSTNELTYANLQIAFDSNSTIYKGSLFDIQNGNFIMSSNNQFNRCYYAQKGAIFYLQNTTKFQDLQSTFLQNSAVQGAVAYLNDVLLSQFNGSIFNSNIGDYGGAIIQRGRVQLQFMNVKVLRSSSRYDGGFLNSFNDDNTVSQDIQFLGDLNQISNCQSYLGNGGCFYIDSQSIVFNISQKMTISNLSVGLQGGLLYSKDSKSIIIQNLQISNLSSGSGGKLLYSEAIQTFIQLQKLSIICQENLSPINVSSVQSSYFNQGSVIYIRNSEQGILSKNNYFSQCFQSNKGGIYYLENTKMLDSENSQYSNNNAKEGGVIYCKNCSVSQTDVIFNNNQAQNGGTFYLLDSFNVSITNIQAKSNYATQSAAFVYALNSISDTSQENYQSYLNLSGSISLNNNNATLQGGSFFFDFTRLDTFINYKDTNSTSTSKLSLTNSNSFQSSGGVFYIKNAGKLYIDDAKIYNISAASYNNGSFIYSESTNLDFRIRNINLQCQDYAQIQTHQNSQISQSGAFYIKNCQNQFQAQNINVQNCRKTTNGGAFSIINSSMALLNSTLVNNSAIMGGGIYCQNCEMYLQNIILDSNQGNQGGSIAINEGIKALSLINITISNSRVYDTNSKGGAFYIQGQVDSTNGYTIQQMLTIENLNVENVSSESYGGFMYISHPGLQLTIQHTNVTKSTAAYGGIFYVDQISQFIINHPGTYQQFSASTTGSFLQSIAQDSIISIQEVDLQCLVGDSLLTQFQRLSSVSSSTTQNKLGTVIDIKDSLSVYIKSLYLANCYNTIEGGFFKFQGVTQASITNSQFYNGSATSGGFSFISNSSVAISNSIIKSFYGQLGGAIYMKDKADLQISNCTFNDLYSSSKGGLIYATQSSDIDPSQTDQYNIIDTYNVKISQSKFNDLKSDSNAAGFYIDSYHLKDLILEDVSFKNISSVNDGGLFYINKMRNSIQIQTSLSSTKNTFSVSSTSSQNSFGAFMFSQCLEMKFYLSNSIFECSQSFDSTKNTKFLNNSQQINSGAFYIQNAQLIESSLNIFRNCYGAKQGGVFSLDTTQLTDNYSQFYQNSATQGGVFYSVSSIINLRKSEINHNSALQGGVFYQLDNTSVIANKTDIQNNYAIQQGGVLNSENINVQISDHCQYTFSDSIINENQVTGGYGGFAYIDNNLGSLKLQSVTLSNHKASVSSGFLFTSNIMLVEIIQSKLSEISSTSTGVIYSTSQLLQLKITNSSLICDSNYQNENLESYLNTKIPTYTMISTIDITGAVSVQVSKSSFSQCGISNKGGIFNLQSTQFSDENSKYFQNSAAYGGAIQMVDGLVKIKNNKFYDNYSRRGGAILISSNSQLLITGSEFYNNYAYEDAGVIYMETGSHANITNSAFHNNYAYENSVLQILEGSQVTNITITQCEFYQNTAQKNTISVIKGSIIIQDSQFSKNLAYERSKNIFAGFSQVYIYRTTFRGTTSSLITSESDNSIGSFIFIIIDVQLFIQDSYFTDGQAVYGGAIYVSGDSQIMIQRSQFSANKAYVSGGAIYGSGFQSISITQNCIFNYNLATNRGDDMYVSNTDGELKLENVAIFNPQAILSIYSDSASVIIKNVTMSYIGTNQSQHDYGAALWCTDCHSILIENSRFSNMVGKIGGIIYIEESFQNKYDKSVKNKYLIKDSHFNHSISNAGGAIYLNNPQQVNISNCVFYNNSAKNFSSEDDSEQQGSGGAIYYDCDRQTLDCVVSIDKATSFLSNWADRQGGAIHWEELEPKFQSQITYKNNLAYQYGNDISCFAQKISQISQDSYIQTLKKLNMYSERMRQLDSLVDSYALSKTESTVQEQRSGGTIPEMYLSLVDKYGQIVSTDSSSKLRVGVNPIQSTSIVNANFPPILEGSSQFIVEGGVVKVNKIQFTATPGYQYGLVFITDGIDIKKKSNKEYMSALSSSDISFQLQVELRDCEIGEQFTVVGKCETCAPGTTFSLIQMTEPGICQQCPTEKAICNGGSNIGPKPGYWRKSNFTSNFVKCEYTYACLGMIAPENNPKGSCLEGYQGIICADCAVGYSRQGDFKCATCPEKVMNIVRLIFIFFAVVFLIVFIVRSTLLGAKEQKNITNIFIKIMMNHLQLILLTASFNFAWPSMVVDFFSQLKPVAQVSNQIFSFDCFVDTRQTSEEMTDSSKKDDYTSFFRVYYLKLIIFAILPVGLMLLCQSFWAIYHKLFKIRSTIINKVMSTLVILLFLVHPSLVQYMFSNFQCKAIDGDYRVLDDLEVICWDNAHNFFSLFIAAPSIIVWGLGIPFFAFVLLRRNQSKLESIETRQKLGFLYRGYKFEQYYWEIVIMYRKIMLVFVQVFISQYGIIAQALIVFVLLTIFIVINMKKRPFATTDLNDLETLSLLSSLVTIYCGIFFLSNMKQSVIDSDPELKTTALQLSQGTLVVLFLVIVTSNVMFLAYWSYKMYIEIKFKLIKKIPKIYMFFCNCGNQEAFHRELKQLQIKEENESLREQFSKIVQGIIKLQKNGQIILNQKNIEKLEVYLDKNQILNLMQNGKNTEFDIFQHKKSARRARINEVKEIKKQDTQMTYKQFDNSIYQNQSYHDLLSITEQEYDSPKKRLRFLPLQIDSSQNGISDNLATPSNMITTGIDYGIPTFTNLSQSFSPQPQRQMKNAVVKFQNWNIQQQRPKGKKSKVLKIQTTLNSTNPINNFQSPIRLRKLTNSPTNKKKNQHYSSLENTEKTLLEQKESSDRSSIKEDDSIVKLPKIKENRDSYGSVDDEDSSYFQDDYEFQIKEDQSQSNQLEKQIKSRHLNEDSPQKSIDTEIENQKYMDAIEQDNLDQEKLKKINTIISLRKQKTRQEEENKMNVLILKKFTRDLRDKIRQRQKPSNISQGDASLKHSGIITSNKSMKIRFRDKIRSRVKTMRREQNQDSVDKFLDIDYSVNNDSIREHSNDSLQDNYDLRLDGGKESQQHQQYQEEIDDISMIDLQENIDSQRSQIQSNQQNKRIKNNFIDQKQQIQSQNVKEQRIIQDFIDIEAFDIQLDEYLFENDQSQSNNNQKSFNYVENNQDVSLNTFSRNSSHRDLVSFREVKQGKTFDEDIIIREGTRNQNIFNMSKDKSFQSLIRGLSLESHVNNDYLKKVMSKLFKDNKPHLNDQQLEQSSNDSNDESDCLDYEQLIEQYKNEIIMDETIQNEGDYKYDEQLEKQQQQF